MSNAEGVGWRQIYSMIFISWETALSEWSRSIFGDTFYSHFMAMTSSALKQNQKNERACCERCTALIVMYADGEFNFIPLRGDNL